MMKKIIIYLSVIVTFLLFILILYVFIVTNTLIPIINILKIYRVYMHILLIVACFSLVVYFLISLYILHKCSILYNKGENITISPVLPADFIIDYLEKLKLYSTDREIVKYVKRMYYAQTVIYTIMFI